MSDEPDRQDLEDRVDQLESTIAKMLPSRRDALKLGGATLVGGAAMSGTASAGTQQTGTIGTSGSPVDVESEDINNADTVTTKDLVVNGTATGVGRDLQGCRVFLSADQSISAGNEPKIQFDVDVYDSNNNFDTTTHDFTCPETGVYAANLQVQYGGGSLDDSRSIHIGSGSNFAPDGDGAANERSDSDANDRMQVTTINKYSQGDTIAGYARNRDSNDIVRDGNNSTKTFIEVVFLGGL